MNQFENDNFWYVNRIKTRLHNLNKNWVCAIVGETGSGKSYTALTLAKQIVNQHNKFHLIFTIPEFTKLLNSKTLQKGDCIILDEAGVSASARDWQSTSNKLFSVILQTFRHKNLALIMTLPNLSFLDIHGRKLCHAILNCVNIDFDNNLVRLKPYDVQVNSLYDKIYYKTPRMMDNSDRVVKVEHLLFDKPSDEVIDWYEKQKTDYTDRLNIKAEKDLEPEVKPKELDLNALASEILVKPDRYLKQHRGKQIADWHLIKIDYKISEIKAKTIKRLVENSIKNDINRCVL